MGQAIGVAEFKSIGRGIEMLDTMTKKANIKIIQNKMICIGKYFILISGEVADVSAAFAELDGLPDSEFVGSKVIPRIEEGVIEKINGKIVRDNIQALGVVETRNLHSGLYCANYIKKSSNVEIIRVSITFGLGGKAIVIFTGDVASVRNAIEVAKEKVDNPKEIVSAVAIPSPSQEFIENLLK